MSINLPPTSSVVERVFTFGYGHTEPVTGEPLAEKYALVRAATAERCRQIMNDRYNRQWSQEYDSLADASVGKWSPKLHVTLIDGPTGATAIYPHCSSTYYGGPCPGEDIQSDGRCPQHTSLLPEQIVISGGAL